MELMLNWMRQKVHLHKFCSCCCTRGPLAGVVWRWRLCIQNQKCANRWGEDIRSASRHFLISFNLQKKTKNKKGGNRRNAILQIIWFTCSYVAVDVQPVFKCTGGAFRYTRCPRRGDAKSVAAAIPYRTGITAFGPCFAAIRFLLCRGSRQCRCLLLRHSSGTTSQ